MRVSITNWILLHRGYPPSGPSSGSRCDRYRIFLCSLVVGRI